MNTIFGMTLKEWQKKLKEPTWGQLKNEFPNIYVETDETYGTHTYIIDGFRFKRTFLDGISMIDGSINIQLASCLVGDCEMWKAPRIHKKKDFDDFLIWYKEKYPIYLENNKRYEEAIKWEKKWLGPYGSFRRFLFGEKSSSLYYKIWDGCKHRQNW